jgi:DNA-binding NarL/FixJ family response regulator
MKPGPNASKSPTPREIKVLRITADGCSLQEAAERLGPPWTSSRISHVLSCLYTRLGIKDLATYHTRKDRRTMAINICKHEGWWPE